MAFSNIICSTLQIILQQKVDGYKRIHLLMWKRWFYKAFLSLENIPSKVLSGNQKAYTLPKVGCLEFGFSTFLWSLLVNSWTAASKLDHNCMHSFPLLYLGYQMLCSQCHLSCIALKMLTHHLFLNYNFFLKILMKTFFSHHDHDHHVSISISLSCR